MNPPTDSPLRKDDLLALLQARRLAEAKTAGEALCRAQPQDAEAWNMLGAVHGALGESETAERCFRRATELAPDYLKAHRNLALSLMSQRKIPAAIESFRAVARLDPADAEAHFNLAAAYHGAKNFGEAIVQYQKALALHPGHVAAQLNLGIALHATGRFEEAEKPLREVVRLEPGRAEAHFHLATVLRNKGDTAAAEPHFRQAVALDPALTDGYVRLALLLEDQLRFDEALDCLERARAADPRSPTVLTNLGVIYMLLGRFEEAAACQDEALRLSPDFASAHYNRAFLDYTRGRYAQSADSARTAIRFRPDYPAAYRLLSLLSLQSGRFADGWRHYASHRSSETDKPLLPSFPWPNDLRGKRILVGRDQGLGDELFFLRFLPQLKARGAWVAYCPAPKLASLLARVEGIDRLVAFGERLEDLAYTVAVSDLPLLLEMDDSSKIPPPLPLRPLPEKMQALRERLSALGPPPYIGVTWRAGTKSKRRLYKESPLATLAEVLKPLSATVLVLQRHPQPGEVESFSRLLARPAHDLSALNEDLEQMLALLDLIEDYVGVSNTNMHLRAGLGKTARVLVPHPPEWRWMAAGEESPWFRGFRVYRQAGDLEWDSALRRLKQDMAAGMGKR